ncbi:MAG TPA: alpha/beta hydrolase, partial [Candidatus Bathyarchaeia archaeon]|nr:alpha/beta hydrolase [Candidatus Bathyarchaeia archaeon]
MYMDTKLTGFNVINNNLFVMAVIKSLLFKMSKIISSGLLSIIILGTVSIIYLNNSVLGKLIDSNDSIPAKANTIQHLVISNVPTRKIHVGDIDIGYKIFGKGYPILLITGANGVRMDVWDPVLLRELASNHTVIVFDNRGVGNTTSGIKVFSIKQFANDTR